MTTGKPWTDQELELISAVYAAMLHTEKMSRQPFNKAAIRRGVVPCLEGRTGGSYEMKMCNISAAMQDAGEPWVTGYKPLKGYQRDLKIIVPLVYSTMSDAIARRLMQRFTEAGAIKK